MKLGHIFDRFVEQSPISVMYRGLLENVFAEDGLNELFDHHAQQVNHCGKHQFSWILPLRVAVEQLIQRRSLI